MDWLKKFTYDSVIYSIQNAMQELVNKYMGSIVEIREQAITMLQSEFFIQAILYVQGIAGLVLALKVAFESWTTYHLRINGDPDADPSGLLERTAHAAAIIATMPWIVQQVWLFGISVQRDVAQLPSTDMGSLQDILLSFFLSLLTRDEEIIAASIGIVIAIVIWLLIAIQTLIFSIEISIMAITGVWMALGLTNPSSNSFSVWWKDLLSTSLIPAVQLLIIKWAFSQWASLDMRTQMAKLLMFIIFMWVAYKIPNAIKQHAANTSSGVGRTTGAVLQQVVMKFLRR